MQCSDGSVTQPRAVLLLFLLALACSAGRAHAEEGLPRVTTPALKMTGVAAQSLRQPKISTPALKMNGLAVQAFRQPKVTTPVLQMTGLAIPALRQPKIATPALKMTGMATQSFRQPKITTPRLEMTGLAVLQTFRQPKITTPSLMMNGLAHDESSLEIPERDIAEPWPDAVREDEVPDRPARYTFLIPVELENMPDKSDRLQVTVTMYSGSQMVGSEMAEKNIRGGSFSNTVSISVTPTAPLPEKTLTYKASLAICDADACAPPAVSREGSLVSQAEIEVPALLMAGNKKDDEVMQNSSDRKTDIEDSFRGGSDRADANAETGIDPDPDGGDEKGTKKPKYSTSEASASGALKSI